MTDPRVAVYPGTFDPITNGHMDIITRAAKVADRLIIAIGEHHDKVPLFPLDERILIVQSEVSGAAAAADIEVRRLDKLVIDLVNEVNADFIIRGLRAVSDFEYELQMANMNTRLNRNVETVFLMASEPNLFIASSLVREIARLGGDVSSLVTPAVAKRMSARFAEHKS